MKPFVPLDCPVLDVIKQEALNYIGIHNDLFADGQFWNKIDSKDFLKNNRTLVKFLMSLRLFPNEVALLKTDKNTPAPGIHVDEPPLVAKINFPILNTHGTLTQWYDVPRHILDSLPKTTNPFGTEVYDFNNAGEFTVIAKTDMSVPVVFNSSIPHAVITTEQSTFPRIVLAVMFENQPLEFLK